MASTEEPQPAPYSITAIFSFPVMATLCGFREGADTTHTAFVRLVGWGHIIIWGEMENLVLMTLSSHTASSEVSADPGEAESPESHRSTIPWWADGAVGERRTVVVTGGNSGICRWGQNSGITQKKHSEYSDLYYSPFLTAFQSFQAQIEAFLSFSLNSNWSDWIHKFEPLKRVINSVLSMLVLL